MKELNESLRSAGIGPFLDSYDINHGEDCWASIEKAIRGAPICICVFSPGYAESQWCLKELAFIWKLRSDKLILPIFYNVEPMHLRDHAIDREGPFYEGMKKMIERVPEADVSNWKVVLDDISKIRGEVLDTNSIEDPEHNSRYYILSLYLASTVSGILPTINCRFQFPALIGSASMSNIVISLF